ncbi:MAG: hypothetical protein HY553_09360 [Elusimicrobia bacterium]|nr:hypothetical protein [Elusimicrobiota bacterium]
MKKLLGLALTLALVIPSGPASAELLKNLKVMGGVDLQGTSARNVVDFRTRANPLSGTSGRDHIGTMASRVWAGLGWDLLDDVHAKVTLRKNNKSWGDAGAGVGQGAGGSEAIGAGGVQAATFVNEAYVKVDKMMGHLDTTWGRQFWGEPGDLIAFWGPKNVYGLFVTAIDALSASASNDWMTFQGIAGKTAGNTIGTVQTGAAVGDTDVQGIDVGWKMLPVKVNTFLWHRQIRNVGAVGAPPTNAAAGGVNDNLWLYGAKLRGEAMGGWFSATAALNSGQARGAGTATGVPSPSANYIGKGLLLDAGYKLDVADIGGFTPWFTWGWGSGRHDTSSNHNENFITIAPDFRPGVIYGRFPAALSPAATALGNTINGAATAGYDGAAGVATAGLTNRIIWGGGMKFNCARNQKMTVGASFWDFSYQRSTQAGAGPAAAQGNRHIGSELDLQVDWAHSENVMLSGGWATFQPGGFIKETSRATATGAGAGVSPATMLFADLSIKF